MRARFVLKSCVVRTRTRGQQRAALRSPFLLTVFAFILGMVGFTQINTPVTQVLAVDEPTPTATALPTQAPTQIETRVALVVPTQTTHASSTHTATRANTATATPTRKPRATKTPTPVAFPSASPTAANTSAPVLRNARVPILMYHHVGELPPNADTLRKSLTVSEARFQEHMQYLAAQGYTTIHLADLVNHLQNGAPLPEKPIVLTFDDGYDDNYLNAFPTLKDFGFKGTFFVIGAPTDYGSPGYMRWEQILEMYENDMEIGAHSLTHRYNLGQFRASIQDSEIKKTHQLMVDHLPNWTPLFSYPSGSYNQYTLDLLSQLGYVAAVTTKQGTLLSGAMPLELRRIRVRGEWSMSQFEYWFNYWLSAGSEK